MDGVKSDEKYSLLKKSLPFLFLIIGIIIGIGIVIIFLREEELEPGPSSDEHPTSEESSVTEDPLSEAESEAEQAGMILSHNNCEGSGPVELTASPMHPDDFSSITPYGMTIGGHVTPIDHQYFNPTIYHSPRDTYEVMAMADGKIVEIQHRLFPEQGTDEFRIVFVHTCTFFTYFDLVTSLDSDIMSEYENNASGNYASDLDIPVEAGDVIGYIGGQTLDFAVWDTEKPLEGFIFPEHYKSETWKIYTADPYDYYSEELLPLMTAKNLRTMEPIAGKIDYDIEGRLIGNWFLEGTNGYGGAGEPYYSGHLSIHPDHIDPTAYWISVGDFEGEPRQFAISRNDPDPAEVSIEDDLVYYDLMDYEYKLPGGGPWDRETVASGITLEASSQNFGCVLFQVLDDNKLTAEFIPGVPCDLVRTPGHLMRTYER